MKLFLFSFQLLSRHAELEQSKTKAQGALVSVLTMTQITELKLLLDIGRQGHTFYHFVLTLIVTCIVLECCVGIIIIYIGNLHYNQSRKRKGICDSFLTCFLCCCRACTRYSNKRNGTYLSVRATSAAGDQSRPRPLSTDMEEEESGGCCDWTAREPRMETIIDLEKSDTTIEIAKVKVADAEVKIVRASNYIRVVEEALKKSPNNPDLEDELARAREELAVAAREKEESEAEQKLAEAQQHHAFFVKEQFEDREERVVYRKGTFWQHCATYLLYFIGLMNFFITTFGISGGRYGPIIAVHNNTVT